MQDHPQYEELAVTIAHCVHARMYEAEPYKNRWKLTVDNMKSSAYQIPTGVLERLAILTPLDNQQRRYDFACLPGEFGNRIAQHKALGCSYDMLVLALICLLHLYPDQPDVRDHLVALGVCEPKPPEDSGSISSAETELVWTGKKQAYERRTHNWSELLTSSSFNDPRL